MILITGGTGFIGRRLIRSFVQVEQKMRVLLRPSRNSPNFPRGVPVAVAVSSFSDERSLRAAMKDVDTIFHLAGAERYGLKGDLNQIDINGTAMLVKAAQQSNVKHIFYLSHLGADRASAYPVLKSKGIAENWIVESGIPYTIFRTASIFGPGDQLTEPILKLLKISPGIFLVPNNGRTLLQPLWVDDLVTCLMLAYEDERMKNRLLSIGGIEMLSYMDIVEMIMQKTGVRRIPVNVTPQFLQTLTLWIDQIYPKFPISIFWLDQLAEDRVTALDSIPREFSLMPSRMKNHLDYLASSPKRIR